MSIPSPHAVTNTVAGFTVVCNSTSDSHSGWSRYPPGYNLFGSNNEQTDDNQVCITMVKQPSTDASKPLPDLSDTTKSTKQASPEPTTANTTSTSSPAGIVVPVKLNPITVLFPVDTVNVAASAAPFLAPVTFAPVTPNWKPAIDVTLLYNTSTLPRLAGCGDGAIAALLLHPVRPNTANIIRRAQRPVISTVRLQRPTRKSARGTNLDCINST